MTASSGDLVVSDAPIDIVEDGFDAGIQLGERIDRDMVAIPVTGDIRMSVVEDEVRDDVARGTLVPVLSVAEGPDAGRAHRDLRARTCGADRAATAACPA